MLRAALCLMLLAGVAVAQPNAGDIIVGDISSTYQVQVLDRTTGAVTPLGPTTTQYQNWLAMAKDNTDIVVALSGSPNDALAHLSPAGAYTVLTALGTSGSPNGLELHENGIEYIVTTSTLNNFRRVLVAGGTPAVTSCVITPTTLNNVARDPDTGDQVVAIFGTSTTGQLDYVGELTCTQTNIAGPGKPSGPLVSMSSVDPEPRTGYFVCTRFLSPQLIVIDPVTGNIVTGASSTSANGVKVDDYTGNYFTVGGTTVREFTPTTPPVVINTWTVTGLSGTSLEIYGSRQISGVGAPAPGLSYGIDFSFRGFGGAFYVGACAFSQRPGIPVGAGVLNLSPDALFFTTLAGVLVTNFSGTLDANGNATGAINIPAFVPTGLTFYCSGIAFTTGGAIQTGNTIGITVR